MKRKLMLIAALVLAMGNIKAEDKVTINDFTLSVGETKEVGIVLENEAIYVAFQFDLYLPEGITVENFYSNPKRIPESTTLSMVQQEDGSFRFLSAAMNGEPITGNNGSIVILTVKATEGLLHGEKTGFFRNVKLAKADATGPTFQEISFPIIVIEPSLVTAKSYTREYGDANPTFEYEVSGGELVGTPAITCEANATSPVGTYDIVITQGTVENYNVTYIGGTLTIEKAPLTISAGTYSKKQGDPMPEFTLTYDGFKDDETEDVLTTKPTISCDADETSAPGEYPIVVSGSEAQNYTISYTEGKLIVTEADPVTITANSFTITYGDPIPEFCYTVEGAELEGEPEIVCEATATSPVGEYPIVIKKGSVTNYNDTYINGVLIIEPAPLTISVQDTVRVYGEENPEFVLTFEGFVNEEDETVLTAQPVVQTEADSSSDAGEYALIASGAEAQNYSLSYTNGTLTIEKAPQEIIWEQEFAEEVMTGDTIALTAHSSCDLPVTYVLSNSDVAVLYEKNGNMYLICTGEGTLEIRATQEGDRNHLAAEDVVKTIVVIINGIGNISGDSSERYYRMEGTETESLSTGFHVVVRKDVDGTRTVKKVFVR